MKTIITNKVLFIYRFEYIKFETKEAAMKLNLLNECLLNERQINVTSAWGKISLAKNHQWEEEGMRNNLLLALAFACREMMDEVD